MQIFPAIDMINGQAVRLKEGEYSTAHKVAESIIETAKSFEKTGASFIHMVDLDGAKAKKAVNKDSVLEVVKNTNLKVEIGGGIRDIETVKMYLDAGVYRCILGSAALNNREFLLEALDLYGDKIVVGIDMKHGTVKTDGWIDDSGVDYIEMAKDMASVGVKTLIVTDISKDGMMQGPSFDVYKTLKEKLENTEIIASGGVSKLDDLVKLNELKVDGAIIGKALYTGDIKLSEALKI